MRLAMKREEKHHHIPEKFKFGILSHSIVSQIVAPKKKQNESEPEKCEKNTNTTDNSKKK